MQLQEVLIYAENELLADGMSVSFCGADADGLPVCNTASDANTAQPTISKPLSTPV